MWRFRKDPVADESLTQVTDRYSTTKNRKRDIWIGSTFAALLVLGGILFLALGGMPTSSTSIEFRDIGHSIDDDTRVQLTFEVTSPPDTELVCELQALNPTYAVVGSKFVELPASADRTRVLSEELRTHNRATTVTVQHCWIPTA
mgnify:CR=1 FL=1